MNCKIIEILFFLKIKEFYCFISKNFIIHLFVFNFFSYILHLHFASSAFVNID